MLQQIPNFAFFFEKKTLYIPILDNFFCPFFIFFKNFVTNFFFTNFVVKNTTFFFYINKPYILNSLDKIDNSKKYQNPHEKYFSKTQSLKYFNS